MRNIIVYCQSKELSIVLNQVYAYLLDIRNYIHPIKAFYAGLVQNQINYVMLDPNIIVDLKSELGTNFGEFNCTTWFPYDISQPDYINFEEKSVKAQKLICNKDDQFPRDKCTAITRPRFKNAPRIQVCRCFY